VQLGGLRELHVTEHGENVKRRYPPFPCLGVRSRAGEKKEKGTGGKPPGKKTASQRHQDVRYSPGTTRSDGKASTGAKRGKKAGPAVERVQRKKANDSTSLNPFQFAKGG